MIKHIFKKNIWYHDDISIELTGRSVVVATWLYAHRPSLHSNEGQENYERGLHTQVLI